MKTQRRAEKHETQAGDPVQLDRNGTKSVLDDLELGGVDRRSRDEMLALLSRSHRASAETCLKGCLRFSDHPWMFWIVPTGPLGEDGRLFIEDQVRSHGGKIA